jgi:hypothetical protein
MSATAVGVDEKIVKNPCGDPGGEVMQRFAAAALTIGALTLTGASPAQAVGTRHPFCLSGDEFPGLSNCTFDTFAQCQATASGRSLSCLANPFFKGESDDPYAYRNRGTALPPGDYPAPPPYRRGY